ncbi:glycoside hydrolase family 97 catalytic domain-containing protein [Kitasatospora sp. NPDC002965]|uniref:glycoside hydrolase family 97 catalytic domain-containing protein n=1 Tax=Kitasatospora sp. NPDC002965 TaxID=3154775 RepID=UPI0033A18A7B
MKSFPSGVLPALAAVVAALMGVAVLAPATARAAGTAQTWSVGQPGSTSGPRIAALVALDDRGALTLGVKRGDTTVLEAAPLGLVTDRADLSTGLSPQSRTDRLVHESYRATTGKRLDRATTMTEARFSFTGGRGTRVDLVVRVSDQGVAYRYDLPTTTGGRVEREVSAFQLPGDATAWLTPYAPGHEKHHGRTTASGAATGSFGYPALFQVRDDYVLLSESGVDGRYAASRLDHTAGSGRYALKLDDTDVDVDGPLTTPWRTATVGDLPGVTGSTFTDDLAPPARITDTSWIRPGKVAWSWLAGARGVQADFEAQKAFVDYSAAHGWPYSVVDDGWAGQSWVPDLVRYAKERGVGIMLWMHWTDLDTAAERDTVLTRMNEWGVVGLKIDYIESETQAQFRWYDDILKATADHRLMVTLHSSTIPNGMQRTWPHVVTMEAVRGAEYKGASIGDMTTIPFTRNVVGSMDYTPMDLQRSGHPNSEASEVALTVVYESGFQHLAGSLEVYRQRPEAERFLEQVPTVWDDSVLVSGRPGEGAVFARRSGDRWFLGSIAAGPAHTERVPLGFLGSGGGSRLVEVVRDGAKGLVRESRRVRSTDVLDVPVPANGGFAAIVCADLPGRTACDEPVERVAPATLTLSSPKAEVEPGAATRIDGRFTVDRYGPVTDVSVQIDTPAGWRAVGTGTTAASLSAGEAVTPSWTLTAPADAAPGTGHDLVVTARYQVVRGGTTSVVTKQRTVRVFVRHPGVVYVSELPFAAQTAGHGPAERDTSNGESEAGDGRTLRIGGRAFDRGLGMHANGSVTVRLGGAYRRFTALVGLDDEVAAGGRGSVVFEVVADGRVVATTPVTTAQSPARSIDVDTSGVTELTLRVTDAGDGRSFDHADWADARLTRN